MPSVAASDLRTASNLSRFFSFPRVFALISDQMSRSLALQWYRNPFREPYVPCLACVWINRGQQG